MNTISVVYGAVLIVGMAFADQSAQLKIVKIENGVNHVDIVGDGTPNRLR
jgi:hypothetical protein